MLEHKVGELGWLGGPFIANEPSFAAQSGRLKGSARIELRAGAFVNNMGKQTGKQVDSTSFISFDLLIYLWMEYIHFGRDHDSFMFDDYISSG